MEQHPLVTEAMRDAQILIELEQTVLQMEELAKRRDALVRMAMATKLRRADIATAAGVSVGRLNQIAREGQ